MVDEANNIGAALAAGARMAEAIKQKMDGKKAFNFQPPRPTH